MGVTGLWKLIEQSGKPVPLETLENKVLAVDISIWLHQAVKGFQDNRGAQLPNAHLLGLFHRLCKLLFYKIKPVFVFDGGVPQLKRDTIAKRSKNRTKYQNEADKIQQLLLDSLAKEKVVQHALGDVAAMLYSPMKAITEQASEKDDIFKLPPIKEDELDGSGEQSTSFTDLSSADSSFDEKSSRNYHLNIQDVDVKSSYFQGLPADIRHEILTDLKETRKESSWGRLHELPAESNNFSSFQMKRLLKRRQVQVELEEAEKEIGGQTLSLIELESLLSEKGIVDPEIAKQRVTSNEHIRYLHVRDLKKAIHKEAIVKEKIETKTKKEEDEKVENVVDIDLVTDSVQEVLEADEEADMQRAIQLSLQNEADNSNSAEDENIGKIRVTKLQRKAFGAAAGSLARDYMVEYGGVNDDEIHELFQSNDNDSNMLNSEFKYNDSFIINGNPAQKPVVSIDNKKVESDFESKPSTSKATDAAVIEIHSSSDSDEGVSSDVDSDFVDVPDPDDLNISLGPTPIISLHMNKPPQVDLSKDFRLSDLKPMEIVVKPSELLKEEDDIFADVFKNSNDSNAQNDQEAQPSIKGQKDAQPEEKVCDMKNILNALDSEMAAVTKINLDSILVSDSPNQPDDEITSFLNSDLKSNVAPASIIDLDEKLESSNVTNVESPTKIKFNESSKVLAPTTPTKSAITKENEETPPKVPQPFFVKRTPPSARKANSNAADSPSKVAKNLFETNALKAVINEADAVETAANLLKEMKSKDELEDIATKLQKNRTEMQMEMNKRDRLGGSITERMTQECMELLRLFGVPYIVAPMEAEAQCAYLNQIELTDGTITDDSDIWLFGGATVYKNFFDQNKHVLEFRSGNIEKLFHVDRKKMIQLSILVGSDYTPGIHGIGTVTALEVLATFNTTAEKEGETSEIMSLLSSLRKFRDWWQNKTITPRTQTLRNKLKNITFADNFPSSHVVQAYLYPEVDKSDEQFAWGSPDAESIREFTKSSFGWTRKKTDDILMPVLKKMSDKISQQSIRNYFKIQGVTSRTELVLSKRVKRALDKISNPIDESGLEADDGKRQKPSALKKVSSKKRVKKIPVAADEAVPNVLPKARNTRKKKAKDDVEPTAEASTSDAAPNVSPYFATPSKKPKIPDLNPPIPQREKDKSILEQNKQKAIALMKKNIKK